MKNENEVETFNKQLEQIKKEIELEDDNLVQIGDRVNLNMIYGEDEPENIDVILTEKAYDLETKEVSISSPLGKLIHLKEIGFQGFYIVNNIKIDVIILNKISKVKKMAL